jgi:hypothetical protein
VHGVCEGTKSSGNGPYFVPSAIQPQFKLQAVPSRDTAKGRSDGLQCQEQQ